METKPVNVKSMEQQIEKINNRLIEQKKKIGKKNKIALSFSGVCIKKNDSGTYLKIGRDLLFCSDLTNKKEEY
ncbi:MAG: hypothetical protein HRK26_04260 [Rickettsiaceae bacterium H1]|nr:hypothetical protein [Rickettsiaceae bacterium H1]